MSAIESAPATIPATNAETFNPSRVPGATRNAQPSISQRPQPGPLRQSQRRDQPGTRHQIRVVEDR